MTRKTLDDLAVLLVQLDPADDAAFHELRAAFDEALASPAYAKPVKTSIVQAVMLLEDAAGDAASRGPALGEVQAHLERAMKLHETPAAPVPAKRSARRKPAVKTAPAKKTTTKPATRPATAPAPEATLLAADADRALVGDFVSESRDYLESSEAALLRLEAEPRDAESINTIFRAFHTIKGTSGFLGVQSAMELAHEAESLLSRMRDGTLVCCADTADLIFRAIDTLKAILDQVERALRGESAAVPPAFAEALMRLRNPELARADASEASVPTPTPPPAPAPASAAVSVGVAAATSPAPAARADAMKGSDATKGSDAMVRVRTERLDQLIEMVGELVIAQSMLSQDETVRHARNIDLARKVAHAEKIVRELQDLSMAMRMVPLKGAFQKVTRLVRDLAHRNGKQVEIESEGEDTEIDRNLVDVLSDPLVHMVRNAVDHGLEPPDARVKAGKPPTGTIRLAAYHAGGNVVVELSDDGRGLDREKIVRKAVERGVIASAEGLSGGEIDNLVFLPGFSTADTVTDISGRGVGMDVVKRNVESMRGRVEITSRAGQGTTFTIRLPLTLAITDGMLVRVGRERYLVPTSQIRLSFRPDRAQLSTIASRGEVVLLRGEVMPVVRLHRVFGIHDAVENPADALLMLVGDGEHPAALLVDELLGKQQVVAKSLGDGLGRVPGVSGGAILGDGCVGLILDVPELVGIARRGTRAEMRPVA